MTCTWPFPFLSNLNSQRDIKTAPRLAFKLNGSSFDTAAEGTPFAQTRKTDATLTLRGFDVKPYLAYMPSGLPFRLQAAVLNADVKLAFEQTPAAVVKLSGVVTADKVRLLDAQQRAPIISKTSKAGKEAPEAGNELLTFDQLRMTMDDVRPLDQSAKLSKVELTAPVLHIVRARNGVLNVLPAVVADAAPATKSVAAPARKQGDSAKNGAQKSAKTSPVAAHPWKVQVASVAVRGGSVNWLDEALASPAEVRLTGISLDASAISVPFAVNAPLRFNGTLGLDVTPATPVSAKPAPAKNGAAARPAVPAMATPTPASLAFSGTATDQAAQLTATVAAWPLNMAAKYIGQFLLPALGGQLDAQLGVNWQAAASDKGQVLQVTAPQISLSDVQLAQGKVSLVSVKRVDVSGVDIDVSGQSFKAAKMQLTQPKALVDRDVDKRWMYERWMVSRSAPAPTTESTKANAPAWAVAITH